MIFEAKPDYVEALDSVGLVKLMKRLMLAESRLAGIALRASSVPLQVTVADGGEDGRAQWQGGAATTAYFPSRLTIFQSKAQDLSVSVLKAEVYKKPKKGPAKLNDALLEALEKGGAYVVFCHRSFTNAKRAKLVKAVRAAIQEAGEDPDKLAAIEVYDANRIADWVNTHPSAALWLASQKLGRPLDGFQTIEAWGLSPDISNVPWVQGDAPRFVPNRDVPKSELKDPTRKAWTDAQASTKVREFLAKERAIVRIAGPSGFGKSRFAFETLSSTIGVADAIDSASAIYTDGSIFGDEAVKLALELADVSLPGIIVVDECNDELHIKLAKMVQRTNSRLRLVTIDVDTRVLQASDTLTLTVERADDPLIQMIAKGIAPELTDTSSRQIAELAEGFPSMAVLAAQLGGVNRSTLESADQILDRIIWAGRQHDPEAQRALEAASLFEWFGLQGRVENQTAYIAATLADMSLAKFVEHLLSFKSRGIVTQRGDFVQVGPVPLAARLGIKRLAVTTESQLSHFFAAASDDLKGSLLRRLRWLDTSPTAVEFARTLLQPSVLGNFAALNTELGSKSLDRLVHVDPDEASAAIERVFGQLTIDELKAARDGRRYLVWALEKLVFRKGTFAPSARLLLRLAAAENETIGNNATGIFQQLYHLYLSGTEAAPAERLQILDEGLASGDPAIRAICVTALGEMMGSHFTRTLGPEQIGSAEALHDWTPKTYGEIHEFHRAAMQRLTTIATNETDANSETARTVLANHIRGLLHQLPPSEVRAMIVRVTSVHGFWPEALSGISRWLFYDRRNTPKDIALGIRNLFDELLPTDPVELAVLYTKGWQLDLHDPDVDYDEAPNAKHDFDYPTRQAVAIAARLASDASLVTRTIEAIACTNAKMAYPLTRELAKLSTDPESLFAEAVAFAEKSGLAPNRGFFGGLISGSDDRDPRIAKRCVRRALQSPRFKADAISLIGSGRVQAEDISLVVSLLKSGDVSPAQTSNLSVGRGLDHLEVETFMPLLEELECQGSDGLWTILDIVGMYLYGGTRQPTKPLVALLKRVVLSPKLIRKTRDNMDGYRLEMTIGHLMDWQQVSATFSGKLARQLLNICRQGADSVFYELDDPVRKVLGRLAALHPTEVWMEVARKLTSKSWHVRFYADHLVANQRHDDSHLSSRITFAMPEWVYLNWVRDDPKARAKIAVSWLAIAQSSPDTTLSWTPGFEKFVDEFGDTDGVLDAVALRLHPSSWWGSLAPILEPIVPLLETWGTHPKSKVSAWATAQASRLKAIIRDERKRDDEDVVRFS